MSTCRTSNALLPPAWGKTIDYFVSLFFIVFNSLATYSANVLVSFIVNVRMAWDKKSALHVLQEELNRPWAPEELVCVYSPSGRRTFFVKDGSLTPKILLDGKNFEKMKTSKKFVFGSIIGDAATAAGDDPICAKLAKSMLRSTMSCPGSGLVEVLGCIAPSISSRLEESNGAPISLYEASLRACLLAMFPAMMGCSLASKIPEGFTVEEMLTKVDRVANAGVASRDPKNDKFLLAVRDTFQSAMALAPKGSFGHSLLGLKDNCPELPDTVPLANAMFYWNAVSCVSSTVFYHFILMMVRHPEDQQRALNDRDFFRRCLKETLRLFSPVSGLMPRRSRRDVQIGNSFVPRSSFVVVIPTLQTKDTEFRPDRWVGNDSLVDAQYDDVPYAPFSSGARACLMRSYGGDFLEQLVWDLFTQFEFDLVDEDVLKNEHPTKHHIADIGIAFRPSQDYRYVVKKRVL